ncbi:hypothetical protein ACFO5R_17425 [Halosolutus amylolyticus]|uniref:Flagellin n=1 Tax=Halosolutus amylolyticus TaxID=2932267 RepID=A0ABD5PTV2_9EURY|nr:hypothetical protein [Halosolutus amylolyticus]
MVTNSRDSDTVQDRGQLILIGAITLAFIVLGVVVVFNGVLFTETLSSSATSQTASDAATTDAEVQQGLGCLIEDANSNHNDTSNLGTAVNDSVEDFADLYRDSTANSKPAVTVVDPDSVSIEYDAASENVTAVNATITHTSNDVSYSKTLTIEPDDCPESD